MDPSIGNYSGFYIGSGAERLVHHRTLNPESGAKAALEAHEPHRQF